MRKENKLFLFDKHIFNVGGQYPYCYCGWWKGSFYLNYVMNSANHPDVCWNAENIVLSLRLESFAWKSNPLQRLVSFRRNSVLVAVFAWNSALIKQLTLSISLRFVILSENERIESWKWNNAPFRSQLLQVASVIEFTFSLRSLPTPRPNQVLGLVGTNGIGKSTALKVVLF